ncbi:MAG: DegT/DnrJ/EryC1/StrS family aminotransferase [Armatimonadetes bacterium]|nr:DegT/DnrJ/EryC1/StrS family aminotransferase [Armatimonadota bacterium]
MTSQRLRESRSVPFIKPYLPEPDALLDDFRAIVASGYLTKGRYLEEFERRASEVLDASFAVGVSSCTTGLMLLLMKLGRDGGEVILPSFTFVASALPVVWNNLEPVFVDCHPDTLNIDPQCVEEAITPRTRAILATHVFGNPADTDALQAIAEKHALALFFDAAHGFGASWRGAGLGNLGTGSAFSCTPTKLVVAGEGGVVTTADEELANMVRVAREYGNPGDYNNTLIGLNGRLPELSALLAVKTIELLEENVGRRRQIASRYRSELGKLPGISFQHINPEGESSYKDFAILIDHKEFGASRDAVAQHLKQRGIDTRKYFDPPVHLQTAFAQWAERYRGRLPVTEMVAERVLCLPIYAGLTDEDVDYVVECIAEAGGHV